MSAPTLPREIEALALLGWRLHPCSPTSRAASFKGALDASTHDLDQLERWAHAYPGCNWRVVMQGSGIWALDCDRPSELHAADGFAVLTRMVAENKPLPARPTTISGGSGGCALFWKDTGHPIRGKSGWPEPGLDPRAGRLTVTVPPSRHHATGRLYRWHVAPWELSPSPAPSWLLKAVAPPPEPPRPPVPEVITTERAQRRLRRALDNITAAAPGTANDTLNREAFAVARHAAVGKIDEREAVEALYAAARSRNVPHHEAKATITSGWRNGLQHPLEVRQ